MSITRRSTKSGSRYDVRLRSHDGIAYKRSFRTRRDAERYERTELMARDRGEWLDPAARGRTFDEIAVEWLSSNPAKRASTLERDRIAIDSHLSPTFGSTRIGSITPADVQIWVNALAARRAPRTVNRSYGVLRAVLNFAIARDVLVRSPLRGIRLPSASPTEARILSQEDLASLALHLGPYAPMAYLGGVLGLRWGEVAALRVRSIDILRRTVEIAEQRTRTSAADPGAFGPPKSKAGRRLLSMPSALAEMLAVHMRHRGLTAADRDALLFVAANGGALDYNHFRTRVWYPAAIKAGLATMVVDNITMEGPRSRPRYHGPGFHDLRRTNGTVLVAGGVDIRTAQQRLGHSDPRLTLQLYVSAVREADRAAADVLGGRLMSM
jgi:integrase